MYKFFNDFTNDDFLVNFSKTMFQKYMYKFFKIEGMYKRYFQ